MSDLKLEEKAKELIEKFRTLEYQTEFGIEIHKLPFLAAKACASILCDEVLRIQNHYDERGEEMRYWESLKQIINQQ